MVSALTLSALATEQVNYSLLKNLRWPFSGEELLMLGDEFYFWNGRESNIVSKGC